MLGPLKARELTDLGTDRYQEFLTLILKPRIAFFCVYLCGKIRLRNLEPIFIIFLLVWVIFRVILGYDVIVNMCTALR